MLCRMFFPYFQKVQERDRDSIGIKRENKQELCKILYGSTNFYMFFAVMEEYSLGIGLYFMNASEYFLELDFGARGLPFRIMIRSMPPALPLPLVPKTLPAQKQLNTSQITCFRVSVNQLLKNFLLLFRSDVIAHNRRLFCHNRALHMVRFSVQQANKGLLNRNGSFQQCFHRGIIAPVLDSANI